MAEIDKTDDLVADYLAKGGIIKQCPIKQFKTKPTFKDVLSYQKRMLRAPTRAEMRFDDILYDALLDFGKPRYKKQRIFKDTWNGKFYIADFYIPIFSLVFEIDGDHHSNNVVYDDIRSSFLGSRGILVKRLKNGETFDYEACKSLVIDILNKRKAQLLDRKERAYRGPKYEYGKGRVNPSRLSKD